MASLLALGVSLDLLDMGKGRRLRGIVRKYVVSQLPVKI